MLLAKLMCGVEMEILQTVVPLGAKRYFRLTNHDHCRVAECSQLDECGMRISDVIRQMLLRGARNVDIVVQGILDLLGNCLIHVKNQQGLKDRANFVHSLALRNKCSLADFQDALPTNQISAFDQFDQDRKDNVR